MDELTFAPIHIALTRSEYAQAAMRTVQVARRSRSWPFKIRIIGYFQMLIIPILAVVAVKAFHPTMANGLLAGMFWWLFVAVICFYAWLRQSGFQYRWLPREDGSALRPQTMSFDETGLSTESPLTSARLNWAAIKLVDDHAGLVLLFVDRATVITIPRRVFPDATAADRFVSAIRSKIEQPAPLVRTAEGPSPTAKWTSRIVLGLIAVLILWHVITWIAAGP